MLAASCSLEIWDSRIIGFTSLLAASMEDDGITYERGRESVDTISALVGLKYFSSTIFRKACDSETGCF